MQVYFHLASFISFFVACNLRSMQTWTMRFPVCFTICFISIEILIFFFFKLVDYLRLNKSYAGFNYYVVNVSYCVTYSDYFLILCCSQSIYLIIIANCFILVRVAFGDNPGNTGHGVGIHPKWNAMLL